MTFRTDAIIDRVEVGRLLEWRAHDRQKQLQGARLVEPTGPTSSRFTEVVEGGLLSLATTDSLIWASSSSLLDPLGLGSPHPDQVRSVAGHVPQLPDRSWRHERGAQHLPLGDLTQPDRVQGVGLGPPGQLLGRRGR
jgi:hypothetical protein